VRWLDARSPRLLDDALAAVAAADAGQAPDPRGPDAADAGAPVRRSLGS